MNEYPKDPLKLFDMGWELAQRDPDAVVEIKRLKKLANKDISRMNKQEFLEEYAWVVYTTAIGFEIIDNKWDDIKNAFFDFEPENISEACFDRVMKYFAHELKAKAVIKTARLLKETSWGQFKERYLNNPKQMQELFYIGKDTRYLLARNLGMNFAKPDRHLLRFSNHCEYGDNVQAFCKYIADNRKKTIPIVDFALWNLGEKNGTLELSHYGKAAPASCTKSENKKPTKKHIQSVDRNIPWTVIPDERAARSYPYSSKPTDNVKDIELVESFSANLETKDIDTQKTFIRLVMVLSKRYSHKCITSDYRFKINEDPFLYLEIKRDYIAVSIKRKHVVFSDPDNRFDTYVEWYYQWVANEEDAESLANYIIKNVRS